MMPGTKARAASTAFCVNGPLFVMGGITAKNRRGTSVGEVRLDKDWLTGAERCDRSVDGERPYGVDALRILPTAWSPAVRAPNGPEFASSPARVEWRNDEPHLDWEQEELEAAATWVARSPPEMTAPVE